jgi:hypothetical protein
MASHDIRTFGWSYHRTEIAVHPRADDSTLAGWLAAGLSRFHLVGLVRHGPSYQVRPPPLPLGLGTARAEGVWAVLGANGKDSTYSHEGHFDLSSQRTLLSDVDVVVVEGSPEGNAPIVFELDPDGNGLETLSAQALGHLIACVGPNRPRFVPPGGIPWFAPHDDGLLEPCLDHLAQVGNRRPLWGLLVGPSDLSNPRVAARAAGLTEHCQRRFVQDADPRWISLGWEPLINAYPALGRLGAVLSCQDADPEAALCVLDDSEDSDRRDVVEHLLEHRDPLRSATVHRELDTHLPSPFPGIWEPKSRIRILQAWAAGLTCPERILTHSRIQLLDRRGSGIG